MSQTLEIECLVKMAIKLDEKCTQNKKDIATIFDLIADIKNCAKDKEAVIEMPLYDEKPTEERIEVIEDSMVDSTIDRRISYHKENNTYKEPDFPTITPLHTLTNADREALEKKIFYDAIFNVETLLGVQRSDPDFRSKVCEESDRLLNVWNEEHKSKKSG